MDQDCIIHAFFYNKILIYLCFFRRKSKGHWDLSTDPPVSSCSSSEDFSTDSSSIKIDLEAIDSSEIPTDLSINEEEWTDYLITEQLTDWDNCTILKDSDNIVIYRRI